MIQILNKGELKMKVFNNTGIITQSANFGWQNKNSALYGLREGYKNSADELIEILLKNGMNTKKLDTYIFPILFSYRHCIEISLKHIYLRTYGKMPTGGHNLLTLWDTVNKEIIEKLIKSNKLYELVKKPENEVVKDYLNDISVSKIRLLIKELQEASQIKSEILPNNKQIDDKAEVWRYLMSVEGELFFQCSHSIDYVCLKESIDYIYIRLDYIYDILNYHL